MAEKPLTLTNREILRVREGLDALANGIVEKAGTNTELTRFVLDDKTEWNVAKNFDIFDRATETYQRARKRVAAKLGVTDRMPLTEQTAPKIAKYQEEEFELLDKTQELPGILRLSRAAIQRDNQKLAGILRNLMPILTD